METLLALMLAPYAVTVAGVHFGTTALSTTPPTRIAKRRNPFPNAL